MIIVNFYFEFLVLWRGEFPFIRTLCYDEIKVKNIVSASELVMS